MAGSSENAELIKLVLKNQDITNKEISEIKKSMELLVRLDEKMINQQSTTNRLDTRVDTLDNIFDELKMRVTTVETTSGVRGRFLIWTASLVSAVVTGVSIVVFGKYLP